MRTYELSHLGDAGLLDALATLVARDRATTAALLACLAEFDARRLYLPAGYPSMFAYCVGEVRLSEDAAYKCITTAQAARQFPSLFQAVAEGRLHLTGVRLLAPHLTAENVEALAAEATHRSRFEIEQLLARHFPQPEVLSLDGGISPVPHPIPGPRAGSQLAPGRVAAAPPALGHARLPVIAPSSLPDRFALNLTIAGTTHGKLRHAQALLAHAIPSGDLEQVLDRALDALIEQVEKRKTGRSSKPRTMPSATTGRRGIPAHVRRAVWQRDGGRCTFIGSNSQRCPARKFIKFDHVDPVARGGRATVDRIRLRCRAHNQYEAERTYGAEFIHERRERARHSAVARGAAAKESVPTSGP